MTAQISDFITGVLKDTDNYIEVMDGNYISVGGKGKFQKECVTITKIISSQLCITYFWHWIYAIGCS